MMPLDTRVATAVVPARSTSASAGQQITDRDPASAASGASFDRHLDDAIRNDGQRDDGDRSEERRTDDAGQPDRPADPADRADSPRRRIRRSAEDPAAGTTPPAILVAPAEPPAVATIAMPLLTAAPAPADETVADLGANGDTTTVAIADPIDPSSVPVAAPTVPSANDSPGVVSAALTIDPLSAPTPAPTDSALVTVPAQPAHPSPASAAPPSPAGPTNASALTAVVPPPADIGAGALDVDDAAPPAAPAAPVTPAAPATPVAPTAPAAAAAAQTQSADVQPGVGSMPRPSRPALAHDGGTTVSPIAPIPTQSAAATGDTGSAGGDGSRQDARPDRSSTALAPAATLAAERPLLHTPGRDVAEVAAAPGRVATGGVSDDLQSGVPARRPALGRLDVDLSGEGLGPLRFRATTVGGQLRVSLTAGDEHVRSALVKHSAELRRDLEAGGADLTALDVGGSTVGHDGAGQNSAGQAGAGPGWLPDDSGTSGRTRTTDASRPGAESASTTPSSSRPTSSLSGHLDRLL